MNLRRVDRTICYDRAKLKNRQDVRIKPPLIIKRSAAHNFSFQGLRRSAKQSVVKCLFAAQEHLLRKSMVFLAFPTRAYVFHGNFLRCLRHPKLFGAMTAAIPMANDLALALRASGAEVQQKRKPESPGAMGSATGSSLREHLFHHQVAAKMAMMAMTTKSSINVKATSPVNPRFCQRASARLP